MEKLNLTKDFNSKNSTIQFIEDEKNHPNMFFKLFFLSIPGVEFLLSLTGLIIWSNLEPLFL